MDGKIDELEIKITADSSEAAASIERLTASLQRLQSAARQTGLDRTSQQLKNVAKTPSMTKLERELARRGYTADRLFCVTANDAGELLLIPRQDAGRHGKGDGA